MPTETHIEIRTSEDRTLTFSLSGPIDATTASEIEYAAWAGSSNLFTTKTLATGVAATDADTITVTIDASDTTGEEAGVYQHELRLSNASSKAQAITIGTLTLTDSKV